MTNLPTLLERLREDRLISPFNEGLDTLVIVVLAICVLTVGVACADPKGPVAPPPPCTGQEQWPDPCYGLATKKPDAGR